MIISLTDTRPVMEGHCNPEMFEITDLYLNFGEGRRVLII